MDLSSSTTSLIRSTGSIGPGVKSGESQWQRPRTVSIHILDDDSILHVFYLCQPFENDVAGGSFQHWRNNGHWWHTFAHVCQRWRNVILGSATYLELSLVCTYGTPVPDMLAHSPPLPLVIGYFEEDRELTTKDEDGIILALKQHHRVRHVRLGIPSPIMQKLLLAMDEEYPILEYLFITIQIADTTSVLRFPGTLQAPHLRHLALSSFALPIGSRLFTAAVGLVTLELIMVHPSTYFHPNTLLQGISLMPHLESLIICFELSIPKRDVERQLTHTPIIAPITLLNLHHFEFYGVTTYLEALVHRITTPRLERLKINFFHQLTYSVPRLLRLIDAAENFRLREAVLTFSDKSVAVGVNFHPETEVYAFGVNVFCWYHDWQVSSMAQIFNSLGQIFSAVEHLILQHDVPVHSRSSEEHNEVDRIEWRKLLRPFSNVKTLSIYNGIVRDLSRCLKSEDGELPLELLPQLQELAYYGSDDIGDAFTSFIDARRDAGYPVSLVRQ